ncbi:MAG TPA: hypothetical protein VK469_14310 [Candidatus Kapabacteria bacterium]|nr:hypothetical protein [Candidatus Kapabacteria bacterium]
MINGICVLRTALLKASPGGKKNSVITGFPPQAFKTSPPGAASIYNLSLIIYN